jgi:hypothetical protein
VFLNTKYKYSLDAADFQQITHDAYTQINTDSFQFTLIQKAKNGDVTAYGTHTYTTDSEGTGEILPFSTSLSTSGDGASKQTVYISYTLRHNDQDWYVTAIDTSAQPIVQAAPQ